MKISTNRPHWPAVLAKLARKVETSITLTRWLSLALLSLLIAACHSGNEATDDHSMRLHLSTVADDGWAQTSVNATVFRKNSLVTHAGQQYIAFYSADGEVMLGKRALGSDDWEVVASGYSGRVSDAHNSISIMVDGAGYLHIAWDHHVDTLRYARSTSPKSLLLSPTLPMTSQNELTVTYPEFHRLPSGELLFAYRDGRSGRGRMVLNHYDHQTMQWSRIHDNLLDGEDERNAYWQMYVADDSTIHLSWVWRETNDVATNHDMHYARSNDGGHNWVNSTGKPYSLPITQASAEIIWPIAQDSNLINQTSMTVDDDGMPYIATYFRATPDEFTQMHVIYLSEGASGDVEHRSWTHTVVSNRQTDFSLSGGGSKSIPISRPQVIAQSVQGKRLVHVIYRDSEYNDQPVLASVNLSRSQTWEIFPLGNSSLDRWEPSFDTELWREQTLLHLYVQPVSQIDAEGLDENALPTSVQVLEIKLPLVLEAE